MEATVETRDFGMHQKLLKDVIQKQAGTIDKAILEGTMNSIEARASRVDITFIVDDENDTACLSIEDDGRGIVTEKELKDHFETFGTPHEENEHKTWAQFRMGRGQLFAFGRNVWRTSTFEMTADIEKLGLKYELRKNLDNAKGCKIFIELYENPIGNWTYPSIDSLKEQVKKQIEFVGTPVYFNDEQLNTMPDSLNWTIEDLDAYYLFNVGEGVKIYNLGAYVKTVSAYVAGTSGVIISKKRLDVNFARNDIKSSCPVFCSIQEVIKKNRIKKASKKYKAMTDYERMALLKDLRDGSQPYYNLQGKRIFRTSQGKWSSLKMIFDNKQKWTFAPEGSRTADMAMEQGKCLCLSEDILNYLNYSGKRALFFEWLLKIQVENAYSYSQKEMKQKTEYKTKNYLAYNKDELTEDNGSIKTLSDGFSSEYIVLANNKLTILEKRILYVLESFNCWDSRTLGIGKSGEAQAWTDGESYIMLERNWLKNLRFNNVCDIAKLFTTLCHELAHCELTEGTHYHGQEFYENYYQITMKRYSPLVYLMAFKDKIEYAKNKKRQDTIIEKQKAKEASIKKKLGMNA